MERPGQRLCFSSASDTTSSVVHSEPDGFVTTTRSTPMHQSNQHNDHDDRNQNDQPTEQYPVDHFAAAPTTAPDRKSVV